MKLSLCLNDINKQINKKEKRYVKMNRIWLFHDIKSFNSGHKSANIFSIISDNKVKGYVCEKCGEFLSKLMGKTYYQCNCGICLITF